MLCTRQWREGNVTCKEKTKMRKRAMADGRIKTDRPRPARSVSDNDDSSRAGRGRNVARGHGTTGAIRARTVLVTYVI